MDAAGLADRPLTLRLVIVLLLMGGSVVHAATDRPQPLAQLMSRARLVVAGNITELDSYDSGRLAVARVQVDRVLKGPASDGEVNVLEHRDLPSAPDLLHGGEHALLFLVPVAHSSSLAQALPAGKYFEPVGGRQGVVAGPASDVHEAADVVARLVAESMTPDPDPARRAALRRALVYDEIGARHPRLIADGALMLPALPDAAQPPSEHERLKVETSLARAELPTWVRVELVTAVGASKLTALAPALRALSHPEPAVLEASWTALRQLGDPPSATDLEPVLASSDPAVRAAAARALLATGDPAALPRVGRLAVEDTSPDTRGAAAEALGDLRQPSVLPALEEVFRRSDASTREAAGRAILHISGRPAQESLARLAFESPSDVQSYAVTLLLLSGIDRNDALVQWIRTTHPDPAIRRLTEQGWPQLHR